MLYHYHHELVMDSKCFGDTSIKIRKRNQNYIDVTFFHVLMWFLKYTSDFFTLKNMVVLM